MELSWAPAFIEAVNQREAGVVAEYLKIGGTRMNEANPYAVIVDRISHEIPYYRTYLKNAVLGGTTVINNPFWWSADDKFFNYALAMKLGVAIPPTVILPHKDHPKGTSEKSMRNLQFPLNWSEIFEYVANGGTVFPLDFTAHATHFIDNGIGLHIRPPSTPPACK